MKNTDKSAPATQASVVDKVAAGKRASLGDQPLTPARKMEAEQKRMQQATHQPSDRKEEDRQVAHLGNKDILTPAKKVAKDSQQRTK